MKSLKNFSMNIPEKEYHAYPAFSYSLLARYAKEGFSCLSKLGEPIEETPSMKFGSLFDCLLTRPEDFEKEYAISDAAVPEAEKRVLDTLAEISDENYFFQVDENDIKKAIEICKYQSRWKYETQYEHIGAYQNYYDLKKSGKIIVSQSEYDDAVEMRNNVVNDSFLGEHFFKKNTQDMEYIYQAQFKILYKIGNNPFDDKCVEIKIMPDMLEVDHKNKTIQPWDIKTSAMPAYEFSDNFVKFRYDIQASLYTYVLERVIEEDDDYRDYTVLPYLFMDISRSDKVPVTYIYDPKNFDQVNGLSFKNYKFKGWKQCLSEIVAYKKSNAVVPSYIKKNRPNDMIALLNRTENVLQ